MKSIFTLLAMGSTALLLTACGGGGGSNTQSTVNTPTTPPKARPIFQTTTPGADQNDGTIQGNLIKINANTHETVGANTATATTNNINNVVIDGKSVAFIPAELSSVGHLTLQSANMARVGGGARLSYTRYGYVREGVNATPYLFAQGQLTSNMPATGTATYKGDAAHIEKGNVGYASATFAVDYAKKTVTGTITPNWTGANAVRLSGTINGNRFTGTSGDFTTNGAFYGSHAAELGGTYSNKKGTISGAYGAKK